MKHLAHFFAKLAIDKAGEINGLDRLDEVSQIDGIETTQEGA